MTANSTSFGRNVRVQAKVEQTPCPDEPAGGPHLLVADARARVACAWCKGSWASLDAALRSVK